MLYRLWLLPRLLDSFSLTSTSTALSMAVLSCSLAFLLLLLSFSLSSILSYPLHALLFPLLPASPPLLPNFISILSL